MKKIKDIIHLFKGDLLEFIEGAEEMNVVQGYNKYSYKEDVKTLEFEYNIHNGVEKIRIIKATEKVEARDNITFDEETGEWLDSELKYIKTIKDILHLFSEDQLEFMEGLELNIEVKEGNNFIQFNDDRKTIDFDYNIIDGKEEIDVTEGTTTLDVFQAVTFDEDGEVEYGDIEYE